MSTVNFKDYVPKYFEKQEFVSCFPSCSMHDMDGRFLWLLDCLRERCGFPIILNCAFRSKSWDISKGRNGLSYHCDGKAADIRCTDAKQRLKIVEQAIGLGMSVGVAKTFVHVDCRPLGGQCLWTYD